MLKVGLTGGIGVGKSLVATIFERLGIPVFYADKEAASILNSSPLALHALVELFGENVLDENNKPDRKKIRSLVFDDEQALKKLNTILHPLVQEYFFEWCINQKGSSFLLMEAAILFESGSHLGLDKIIVVTSPTDLRLSRVVQRDKVTEQAVKTIMNRQFSEEKLIEKADFVISNDEQQLLIPQVIKVFDELNKLAGIKHRA